MIYLDHNASTPVRPEALDAMLPYLKGEYGNPSSIYQLGQHARKAIEDAREAVAAFVGADDPAEIIFTSGGTESNNAAIKGTVESAATGRHVVTSAIEHSSVRNVVRHLVGLGRVTSTVVPVQPDGVIAVGDVEKAITPETALVTIMAANNEIGTVQPTADIARICRAKGVPFHSDGVQLGGKRRILVNELGVDLLTISGHKIGAPKGVGALYIRKGTRLHALLHGGRQEKNRRAGTENVAAIAAMGAAAQATARDLDREIARLGSIRDRFEKALVARLPLVFVNGDPARRLPNTSNLCIEYTDSTEMIMALDLKGVACSNGSACAVGSAEPSHVLVALGLPQDKAHASLRFSFGVTSTEEEADRAATIVAETAERLRQGHPLWRERKAG